MKKVCSLVLVLAMLLTVGTGIYAEEPETAEELSYPTGGYRTRETELLSNREEMETLSVDRPMLYTSGETETEDTAYENLYGYQALCQENAAYGECYKLIYHAMLEGANEINIASYRFTVSEAGKVYYAFLNDNPQYFYAANGFYFYKITGSNPERVSRLLPMYLETWTNEESVEAFEAAADALLQKSGARAEMSDYDKALMLHNALAEHIVYDEEALKAYQAAEEITDADQWEAEMERLEKIYGCVHTAYGALVNGRAVCDGYSKAYQYLLYQVGILSHVATGTGNGGGHAWNLVRLDGDWYYTDLTWDDNKDGPVFYGNFNMTTKQSELGTHVITSGLLMPECTDTELNYYAINGGVMGTEGDAELMAEQIKKQSYARIYLEDTVTDLAALGEWFKQHHGEIARLVGLNGYSYGYSRKGREYIFRMHHDTAHPLRNPGIEVCSSTQKACRVLAGFYDAEGRLLRMGVSQDITLEPRVMWMVSFDNAPEEYDAIRYFVWDSVNGLKPLYQENTETY